MKKLFTNIKSIFATALLILCFGTAAKAQVVVVATAATMGPTVYPTVNDAFIAINNGIHQGDIGVAIMANTTEAGPCVLNASGAGAAIYTTVTIAPGTDGVSITGATPFGRGLIELNGADNVIIDGDNPNTVGINRNLTLVNSAVNTTTYTSVVRVALSTLVSSGDNIVVRNCIINGSATGRNIAGATNTTGSENSTYGILLGGNASTVANTTAPSAITSVTATIGAGITANNFTVTNNIIDACARGIAVQGSSASVVNLLTVTNNTIGSATPGNTTTVYARGMTVQGFTAANISGNTVRNIEYFVGTAMMGIGICDISANGTNALCENNIVDGVLNSNTGTFGAYGINVNGGTNHTLRNNFISGINHNMTGGAAFSTTFGVFGIRVGGGTGHNILYNSVNLYGTRTGTPATSLLSAAFAIVTTAQTGCTVQNNIFANNLTGGTTTIASVSIYLPTGGTSAMNLTINNNAYYCGTNAASMGICQRSTTYSAANLFLPGNFIQAATAPATNLRSYTSTLSVSGNNDNASWAFTATPPFVTNSDLHINIAAPNVTDVDSRAAVNAVTTDIDGNARTATPDIGADEFALPNCSSANGGTVSPSTVTVCNGATTTMTSVGATFGTGITYQWMVATVSGGPYVNVTGGSGATTTTYNTAPLTAGTYYYVLQTTCSFGPLTGLSNELTVTVNPSPTLSVNPTSATYCVPGSPVALTASGTSVSYSWGPAAGLSATTGANVDASPSATTTYTVTGTDGNGCTATATTAISVAATPSVSVTSTPSVICAGDNAALVANGAFTFTYCQPVYTNGTGFGDYISSVVLNTLTNTTVGSPAPYYTLYPASGNTTTTLVAGTTYTITISPGTYNINDVAAWIDFNQNGNLADPLEKLGETDNMPATPATTSFIFTVPVTALNGPTRLRVRDVDHGGTNDMDPCAAQSTFGETEDYVITIVGGVDALTYAWSPATYLSATTGASVTATAAMATTTYTVVGTSAAGCTGSASTTLTVNALPAVTASVSANPSCVNDQITFNGGGATSYTWTGGVVDNTPYTNTAAGSFSYTVTGTDANGCTNTASVSITVNSLPVVTLSGNSTICAGDTSFLTGSSGGTSQWYLNGSPIVGATSNTYAATAPGVYNMTKTNLNGCGDSAAVGITLVVNATPTVTASATPSTVCAGDMVTATGSGATSYAWSGGISDNVPFAAMATMTYTVTGTDANGCEDIDSVTVTVNALPMVAAMSSDTNTCLNDMVTFMGMGATSYTWNNGVTDMVPYMVTVTDTFIVTGTDANGCVAVDSIVITVNALPVVIASASDSLVCAGDSVTFMGSGAVTYAWDNGVVDMMPYSVMASDTFIVIGTDANGCTGTDSVAVVANANPAVTLLLPLDTACLLLGPVTLGGETPAGGTWSGTGVTGNSFDPGVAGNGMHAIMYTYMDSLTGCSSTAIDSILVDICNSIDNNNVGTAVVYPNPNNGDFTLIPAGSGLVDVMIYNATGQLVVAEKATAGQPNQIKLEASGMYSVVIVTADGTRTTQRVVVNR